jgi:small subunit ribosomal protein S18
LGTKSRLATPSNVKDLKGSFVMAEENVTPGSTGSSSTGSSHSSGHSSSGHSSGGHSSGGHSSGGHSSSSGPGGDRRGPRPGGPGGPGGRKFFRRKKVCKFCVEKIDAIPYRDVRLLQQFVAERGKIVPRRLTGVCTRHQRALTHSIKQARNIALLPFAARH